MKLTFCICLEGGITVVEAFAVFFQTLHRLLIYQQFSQTLIWDSNRWLTSFVVP